MNARRQITMDPEMQRRAHAKAAELGKPNSDISVIFDLVTEGEPTDITRDKDKMIGDAVWQEYLQDVR